MSGDAGAGALFTLDPTRAYPVLDHIAMWSAAGLEDVVARPMSLGGGLVMSGRRRHG